MNTDDNYTFIGLLEGLDVYRCYGCGAMVDGKGIADHDEFHDGYNHVIRSSMWVDRKRMEEMR